MTNLPCALAAAVVAGFALPAAAAPAQTFQTDAGAVTITPIYHATAVIQAGGDRIYIDPAKPAKIDGMPPGDLILITDVHGDHMDSADVSALSKSGTAIIAPAAVQKTVAGARVLGNGQSTMWHKWKITAVPMYNITHMQPSGAPYHEKGRGNGYILAYGGKNFYFAGDTEGTPEMRALKKIDVAFIPMNLPYTMTPGEAADAVRAFHPDVAIPYHYKGQDITKFRDALNGSGIEVRLLDWYGEN
ncbi:MAG: MBL fold metallo-hydrolase [Alphaproteobacteria bacterium]|nr:MBL fold metallo-hydrolase [Alphaproteobacteria bacterium]